MSCKSCDYYDYEGPDTKGYCEYYKSYYYPTDYCSHEKNGPSGCYVTTIVHNILKLDDNCIELETLRNLRKDMQQDVRCAGLLYEYDTVGPQIAEDIEQEFIVNNEEEKEKSLELYTLIFNFYIQKTARLYRENKYDEAIIHYKEMFNSLKDRFGYKELPYIIPEDYNYSTGGHGYIKTI